MLSTSDMAYFCTAVCTDFALLPRMAGTLEQCSGHSTNLLPDHQHALAVIPYHT